LRNIFTGSFPEPYLLAVGNTKIAVVDLTTNYSTFVIEGQNIENLIIDPVDDKMYFKTDIGVQRANFDGYDKEVIYQNGKNSIRVFALDWIRRRMYYVHTKLTSWIFEGNMKLITKTRVHVSDEKISSLAVDPNAG
jgi:membrane carboxypeptidase/penicillin-binding protein